MTEAEGVNNIWFKRWFLWGSATDPKSFSIQFKDAAVLIPVIHLVSTCFLMIGYSYGFYRHIAQYFTFSDVFASSIRGMDQVYLFLFLPALIFGVRRSYGGLPANKLWLIALAVAIELLIAISTLSEQMRSAHTLNAYQIMLFLALLIIFLGALYAATNLPAMSFLWTFLACLVLFSLTLGWGKGLREKDRIYAQSLHKYVRCADYPVLIIRPMGERFLAIRSDNQWLVVDKDCETTASFSPENN